MSGDGPPDPPGAPTRSASTPTSAISSEELAGLIAASGPVPGADAPGDHAGKRSLRRKLIVAALIAGVGVGASAMSCVGQSFSYRQARALEGIEQQLREIRAGCTPAPPTAEQP